MQTQGFHTVARRSFLAGSAAIAIAALPGCSSMGGFSLVEAVRRLLELSTMRAFAQLTAPGGFWDSQVARIGLPEIFGRRGGIAQSILTSALFRDRLQHQLNLVAERGAERAAPMVTDAVRTIGIGNALAILRGGPQAATVLLREQMGIALIEAMVPALSDALRIASDPIVAQAIGLLAGVDINGIARSVSEEADNAIWAQIGAEEAAIRANPESTNDPVLIGVFKTL